MIVNRRNVAARVAKWLERGSPVTIGLPASGAVPGVPILASQFGNNVNLVVEIAWAASLSADPSTWSWVDVTTDVQVENLNKQIDIIPGHADEASVTQPAEMTLVLDNRTNRYSKSPLSPNWPNVKRNTPVRIRIVAYGVSYVRFFGYATSFEPSWDATGDYATVDLAAHGSLRRLNQGTEPLRSPLERALAASNVIAYWPMEDGATATAFSSPLPGVVAAAFVGLTLASQTTLVSSEPLPVFDTTGTGQINAVVPAYTATQYWEVHYEQLWTQGANDVVILRVNTTGTYRIWEIVARGSGSGLGLTATLNVYDAAGTQTTLINSGWSSLFFGNWTHGKLFISESAGTLTWHWQYIVAATDVGGDQNGTIAGVAGQVLSVTNNPDANRNGLAIGHLAVWNAPVTNSSTIDQATQGYSGESPVTRLQRLCTEQGESITATGTSNATMGPQQVDTFVNLLRACEKVDQGLLYDGFNAGLSYLSRDLRENALPMLVLNAATQDLTPPFKPADDDLLNLNKFTASRVGGSSATVQDTTSVTGSNTIGNYNSSDTFNNSSDTDLIQYAGWKVHAGSFDGYRFPTMEFSIHRRPALLLAWLQTQLLTPISVINIQAALSQMPSDTINSVLLGYTESINQLIWDVTANGSPADIWRITVLAADTGDTGTFLCRLESDGTTVIGDQPPGANSFTVVVPSGPLWTVVADDFPLYVTISGLRITVNGVITLVLNSNSTFESGVSPWTVGGGTLAQSSTQTHSGSFSGKVTPDGVSANVDIISEMVPVTAGVPCVATAWVWFTSGVTNNYSTSIAWYDSAGVFISTASVFMSVSATTWTQVVGTFTAPANASFAAIVPLLQGTPAAAQVWYVDDATITSNKQTFTVDGATVLKAINNGDAVTVWDETVLGL